MNALDIVIVAWLLLSIHWGYKRGATKEIISLCVLVVGFLLSFGLGEKLYAFLWPHVATHGVPAHGGYLVFIVVLSFVVMALVLNFVSGFVKWTVKTLGLMPIERVLGAVISPIKCFLWLSFLAGMLEMSSVKQLKKYREGSRCYSFSVRLSNVGKKTAGELF